MGKRENGGRWGVGGVAPTVKSINSDNARKYLKFSHSNHLINMIHWRRKISSCSYVENHHIPPLGFISIMIEAVESSAMNTLPYLSQEIFFHADSFLFFIFFSFLRFAC